MAGKDFLIFMSSGKRQKTEKELLLLSFFAGLVLAIAELIFSIFSHSQSVLMDAVYDATELIFIALILFLTPLFYKPVSEKHPFGFFQVESIFLIVKGFMLLAVSVSVTAGVIESLLSGGNPVDGLQIAMFQFFQAIVSIVIYTVMRKRNTALCSPTVDMEILGWKIDIAYSGGLAVAFLASRILDRTPLAFIAPYFDQIMAILIMLFMLPETVRMLWGAIKDVFLFPPEEETVSKIKEVCSAIMEESALDPVFFDITRTGRHIWVSIYFTTEKTTLSVSALKAINDNINQEVGNYFENCSCELILDS